MVGDPSTSVTDDSTRARSDLEAQQNAPYVNWQRLLPILSLARHFDEQYQQTWSQKTLHYSITTYRQILSVLSSSYTDNCTCYLERSTTSIYEVGLHVAEVQCYPCTRRYGAIGLADGLYNRFLHDGIPDDIYQVIELCDATLHNVHPQHPLSLRAVVLLGNALRLRCIMCNDLDTLERAIAIQQDGVSQYPDNTLEYSLALLNFGSTLWRYFERKGNIDDLHRSIAVQEQALALCGRDDSSRTPYLSEMARGLRMRSNHGGPTEDLKSAQRLSLQAMEIAPPGYRDLNAIQVELGWINLMFYRDSGVVTHLDQAEQLFRVAMSGGNYQARRDAREYLPAIYMYRYELDGRGCG